MKKLTRFAFFILPLLSILCESAKAEVENATMECGRRGRCAVQWEEKKGASHMLFSASTHKFPIALLNAYLRRNQQRNSVASRAIFAT
jgi:hypothetical protein